MDMSKSIKVIDLFAGPGGLGEGFSAFSEGKFFPFKISISIEKETSAHRTLQLRALFRQFRNTEVPESYYSFLKGELGKHPEDELYQLPELKDALRVAAREAQQLTLGEDSPKTVYGKIRSALSSEDCILIGGPPCQAYSLVGRARNYGAKDRKYVATEDHRNFLYKEYLKVIAKFQPLVFVMENVKGMLSAKVDGKLIFPSIRYDLQNPCKSVNTKPDTGRKAYNYRIYSFVPQAGTLKLFDNNSHSGEEKNLMPKDFIIRAEDYGVPQERHRVILLGIREDVAEGINNVQLLKKSANSPTVKQVISDLPDIRSKLSKSEDSPEFWRSVVQDFDKATLKALRIGVHSGDKVYDDLMENLGRINKSPTGAGQDKGLKKKEYNNKLNPSLKNWYEDKRLNGFIANHEARGHITGDLRRYFYYSSFAKTTGVSPKSFNLPEVLWPKHKNFSTGKFADRFRVQLENHPGKTVTSHISKDGHYFIHYDPRQCRSFTVREAARIQTFPDNYYFVGNRTQQYVQVGNAVPPYLAKQLAEVVFKLLK
jgi:DNA (cytosine-5)-methyltransferase 1